MTEQQWHEATEEEKHAEYVRCQDTYYFYTTYFRLSDGSEPPPITKEKFNEIVGRLEYLRAARFNRLRNTIKHLTKHDSSKTKSKRHLQ